MATKRTHTQKVFQVWLATPDQQRIPESQTAFAKMHRLNRVTLSKWKRKPGFIDEVTAIARQYLQDETAQVYAALVREAKKGSFQHIQLVLELAGQIDPQQADHATVIIIDRAKDVSTLPAHLARRSNGYNKAAPEA